MFDAYTVGVGDRGDVLLCHFVPLTGICKVPSKLFACPS